jgi:RNA polymerase sigma factor (TIGR02999 family)
MSEQSSGITELLSSVRGGNREAESALVKLVYTELHQMAARLMRFERGDHTLQPTALVNEAYMRLISSGDRHWRNRTHFFAVAASAMRAILVDYARAHGAKKRGGDLHRVEMDHLVSFGPHNYEETLAVDEALHRLAQVDPRQSRIVELRYFVGLSEEEIAEALQISCRTVKRDWNVARAWLYGELHARADAEDSCEKGGTNRQRGASPE